MRRIPVEQIADNPDNPPARVDDVAELAESMRQVGQLQPGLVVAAEDFLAEMPHHAESVGSHPWVLLAGHRRRAAAVLAGLEQFEALERSAVRMDEAILHENLHREALSPLEEAHAFARVMERQGLSQRKMAEHAGVSQSHIAKRLKLLELPEVLQHKVTIGDISPAAALALLTAESPETVDEVAAQVKDAEELESLAAVTGRARRRVEERKRIEEAEVKAKAEDASFVADPQEAWPGDWWQHRLHDERQIAQARERGDLAYAPSQVGPTEPQAYRLSAPEQEKTAASTVSEEAAATKKLKQEADRARAAFLRSTAARKPATPEVGRLMTLCTLSGLSMSSHVTRAARKLAQEVGVGPTDSEDWDWRRALANVAKAAHREHLAWIVCLAVLEDQAKNSATDHWRAEVVTYLDHLISRGYEPTEWETTRLDEARTELDETTQEQA